MVQQRKRAFITLHKLKPISARADRGTRGQDSKKTLKDKTVVRYHEVVKMFKNSTKKKIHIRKVEEREVLFCGQLW